MKQRVIPVFDTWMLGEAAYSSYMSWVRLWAEGIRSFAPPRGPWLGVESYG